MRRNSPLAILGTPAAIRLAVAAAALLASTLLVGATASAQGRKDIDNEIYENARWGFAFYPLAKWNAVPPQPDEEYQVAKFEAPQALAHKTGAWHCNFEVLRFDAEGKSAANLDQGRTGGPTTGGEGKEGEGKEGDGKLTPDDIRRMRDQLRKRSYEEYLKDLGDRVKNKKPPKKQRFKKNQAVVHEFETPSSQKGINYRFFAVVFKHPDKSEIVLEFSMPEFKYDDWKPVFVRSAETFQFIEKQNDDPNRFEGLTILERDRMRHEEEVNLTPGWQLIETDHYFIKTSVDNARFLKELQERIEAIRKVYVARFLPQGEPKELLKKPVLRVTKNFDEYFQYGGPPGSGGYFNSQTEELVVPCFKEIGLTLTWAILNHEGFHQFIHTFFGDLSPHSWYNEGTGDYYAGFQYKGHDHWEIKPLGAWAGGVDRLSTIREAVRKAEYVPLEDILRYTQQQYYAKAGLCYAQGWSIIYFLMRAKDQGWRPWNDDWDRILPDYLEKLSETKKLEDAVEFALRNLKGQKMQEFEDSWKAYMDKGIR